MDLIPTLILLNSESDLDHYLDTNFEDLDFSHLHIIEPSLKTITQALEEVCAV